MKFKDFQAPVLFSSTFKALNLGEKNSSTFKDFQGCVGTLTNSTFNFGDIGLTIYKLQYSVFAFNSFQYR